MHKKFLQLAAIGGAISVALGAFGAHGLKEILSAQALLTFETAVRYQFYHVFALALTGLLMKGHPGKEWNIAGNLFVSGILLFSGSLYLLCFLGTENFKWIGAITPLGGICFLGGWTCLFIGITRRVV